MQHWLVMTRAAVLIMTVCAALIGVLLATVDGHFFADRLFALLVGLTLAHATNNLINDWVDHQQGVDRNNYFRQQYGVHVLEDRLIGKRSFLSITAVTGAGALICAIYLYHVLGDAVFYLTLAGGFFVVFYTWPLKHFGLGELAVLLVWGPLIVAGSYYVMSGSMSATVIAISLLSGISPTLVIFGKHMDKRTHDVEKAIHTLPVIAGEDRSRQICLALLTTQWLMITVMAAMGNLWLVACLIALPGLYPLIKALRTRAPNTKPDDYPDSVWPLWFAALAFRYTRDFYLALLLGLLGYLLFI